MKRQEQKNSLTQGPILRSLLLFAFPMMCGNLLQQVYNVTDALIVGRFIGADALAAVGSAYSLMTFLTSLIIGLCMGSGALFSASFGAGKMDQFRKDMVLSFYFVGCVTLVICLIIFPGTDFILTALRTPAEIFGEMKDYVQMIFCGIAFTFLYNFFAYLLRSVGNSVVPLYFLGTASLLNILLDLLFVIYLGRGVRGAAEATVIAQAVSGLGLAGYVVRMSRRPGPLSCFYVSGKDLKPDLSRLAKIISNDLATGLQQSVMNFGILMIQGLVNSFGTQIMAAFAANVKIDTLAYMPAQEFGNAYSIFISTNYGAGKKDRMREGTKKAFLTSILFCIAVSVLVWFAAERLIGLFVDPSETTIIAEGIRYLHIEGSCYFGIGILFLWYGYFRGIQIPVMSLILTIVSLGSRVLIAYSLAPHTALGVIAIWMAIPIGWVLADLVGLTAYKKLPAKV